MDGRGRPVPGSCRLRAETVPDFVPRLRPAAARATLAGSDASSSRRSGCTAARSAGSLTGRKRPRAPCRGTTRNVVGTCAESSW